jgi:putative transcriptional regulator
VTMTREREDIAVSRGHFQYVGGQSEPLRTGIDCELCGAEVALRKATVEDPYPYELSGLKDVALVGIAVRRCTNCGAEVPIIPRIADLHRTIADGLIRKPAPLTGREIRFLRKNAGLAARKFAALLGIDPSHLSRVETGKTGKLGASTDRLARAVVMAESQGGEAARQVLLDTAKKKQAEREEKKRKRRAGQLQLFTLRGNRWAA